MPNPEDPVVQTTISIRKSQLDVAHRKVNMGEAKNVSRAIGKALDYVEANDVTFVET